MAFAQQRLWFLDQLEPGSAAYILPRAIRLTGILNVAALEKSFNEIVRRHEILRTRFAVVDGQPVQVIAPALECRLAIAGLRPLPDAEQAQQVQQLASQEAETPFNLAQGPLLRLKLLQLSQTEHVLLLTMHHIVSDAWSTGVLVRELVALYAAFVAGHPSPLPELPIQYADFAHWQRQQLQGTLSKQLAYWQQQLKGELPVLHLPGQRRRSAASSRGARQARTLPPALTAALRQLGQEQGATLFMTLLAAFKTLLYRYTEETDILVGFAIANRNQAEVEGMIGFFVNTLVLRTDLSGNPSFQELLGRVREVALGAYTHQDLPFEVLVEALQPQRQLERTPLFQVMFSLQNAPVPPLTLPGLSLESLKTDTNAALVDLSLDLVETAEGLSVSLEYRLNLFPAATITRLLDHFQVLLAGVVSDPGQRLSDLPLMSYTEHLQLLQARALPQIQIPDQCIHQLFEAQAERSPDAVAVVFGDLQLTYRELNARANQLAHYLQHLGVGPDKLVGLCVERSLEMVVGLFAVLKAGGAYVPLDPSYPQERLTWMLEDAQVTVLLTQRSLASRPAASGIRVVCQDQDRDACTQSQANLLSGVTPADLTYVIYTSGSTGSPKGVLVQQRSLVNFSLAASRAYAIQRGDTVLQFASISFDAAAEEIFPCLVQGGRLVLRTEELSATRFLHACRRFSLSVLGLPTAYWHQLTLELAAADLVLPSCLRLVIIGGEAARPERLLLWRQIAPHVRLINSYGPTEATVVATISELLAVPATQMEERVPIGHAIANVQTYVLDSHCQPTPVGVPGELHLGGPGVALGYLHRPGLTAEQFIPDPFSPLPGARLYKTGDRVRYREDGQLEFLGRVDRQVKIRGYRIELAEIEFVLQQQATVREAVVIAQEDPDGSRLVACLVPQAGTTPVIPDLQRHLKTKLPAYMVPTVFVCLDALPLTPSGKVNRQALPTPEASPRLASDPPRTPAEEMLAEIWEQVLSVRVGRDDNFFDLGGHSLLAAQVISRVRDHFQIELPLRCLFEAPTVAELAERIEEMRDSDPHQNIPSIEPAERNRPLPLSLAQQQLWFLQQLQPGSPVYNLPVAARLHGPLDVTALEDSFNTVIQRHEALRTTFTAVFGQPMQAIAPTLRLTLPVIDLRSLPEQRRQAEVQQLAAAAAQYPFDLEQGPLLRACLLQLAESEFVLLLTMHHIISDGWSLGVLVRELGALYTAYYASGQPSPLPELPIQYADFAVWQRQWLAGEEPQAHLAYWQQQLRGLQPVLLQTDRPRPLGPGRGASDRLQLSPELTQGLLSLSRQEGATLFMTLLAAFKVLLHRYTHRSDIVVGTDVASRNRVETEPLIGFFVNLLVLRTDLSGNPRFQELLRRVRQVTLAAYAHPLPFAKLVEALQPQRHLQQTPLFQVLFVLQNTPLPTLALPGLSLEPLDGVELDPGSAKFDLALLMEETPQGLRGTWRYNADLFDAATIARLSSHFQTLLTSVLAQPQARIDSLELWTDTEKAQQALEVTQQAERKFATFKRTQPKGVRLIREPESE